MRDLVLVTGAGGFIGGHLVRDLYDKGFQVRAVDVKPLDDWYQLHTSVQNLRLDLRQRECCDYAVSGVRSVFHLAADMGGMGFIERNRVACMMSVLVDAHMLQASVDHGVQRFLYSSSACVYPEYRQTRAKVVPLKESDAYPAMPEDGYGWEKLYVERLCQHFSTELGLTTRVVRYHNVYGPYGTWEGGREKAPAAICRKVAQAKLTGEFDIDIWGDGQQTRSFMYIDDCIFGTEALMASRVSEPLNLGSSQLVTVNRLVDIVEEIAGTSLHRHYDFSAPKGVRGRNSDNTLLRERLGWEPSISLAEGLEKTYRWIHDQVAGRLVPSAELTPA